jgi:hypothetical protein
MLIDAFDHIEPPWYGPVCLVVWEGGSREAPPYPDSAQDAGDAIAQRRTITPSVLFLIQFSVFI